MEEGTFSSVSGNRLGLWFLYIDTKNQCVNSNQRGFSPTSCLAPCVTTPAAITHSLPGPWRITYSTFMEHLLLSGYKVIWSLVPTPWKTHLVGRQASQCSDRCCHRSGDRGCGSRGVTLTQRGALGSFLGEGQLSRVMFSRVGDAWQARAEGTDPAAVVPWLSMLALCRAHS